MTEAPLPNDNGMFISHAHDDVELVRALKEMLRDLYSDYFDVFATSVTPLKGGQVWRDEIREHLAKSKVMLVLITPISVKRIWIPFEAGAAWLDSTDRKKTLIPCRFSYDNFTSPLSEFQGVNLLEEESISSILIPALNDITRLKPSPRFLPSIIKNFLDEAEKIKSSQQYLSETLETPLKFDLPRFFDLTIGFFKEDKHAARRYIDMLRRHNILIDEDSFQEFLIQINAQ